MGTETKAKTTLQDFLCRYLQYAQANRVPQAYCPDPRVLRDFAVYLRNVNLDTVTPETLEAWKAQRAKQVSPVTVNTELCHIRTALAAAERWGVIERDPFRSMRKLPADVKAPQFLRSEEIQAVLKALAPKIKPFVLIALYTGLSRGEITHLCWQDIDFDAGLIHLVDRQHLHTEPGRERSVPLHPDLGPILKAIPKTGPQLWPYRREDTLTKEFRRAARKAGLSEDVRLHALRQAFAAPLADLGPMGGAAQTCDNALPLSRPRTANVLRKEGDYWTIRYEGKEIRLNDSKGLHDIAYLLARPGQHIHVFELVRSLEKQPVEARAGLLDGMSAEQLEEEDLRKSALGGAGLAPDLDETIAQCRRQLDECRDDLEEAERLNDIGTATSLKKEIEFIEKYLREAYATRRHARSAADPSEKARKAVSKRIIESRDRMKNEHPFLWQHLKAHLHTGTLCSYTPEEPCDWIL